MEVQNTGVHTGVKLKPRGMIFFHDIKIFLNVLFNLSVKTKYRIIIR